MLMLLLSLWMSQAPAAPQAEGPRPPARIADVSWLVGAWEGEGLGGTVDEVWSPAAGGAMVGHFRLVRDGKPVFYEILTILEIDGSLEMRLKHVNPDMTGWEEKANFITFRLAKLDETGAYFGAFSFIRKGPDHLEGVLRMRQGDQVRDETFTFRRVTGR